MMFHQDQSIINAKLTLSNVPDEVFELWLNDRIRQNGWPPLGYEWEGFLCGESLQYWSTLSWKKVAIQLTSHYLSYTSRCITHQIYEASVLNKENAISMYIPNTRERFSAIVTYALQHKTIPGTLVLLKRNDVFDIVDGNHRVSALIYLQTIEDLSYIPKIFEVQAWVAEQV